MDYEMKIGWGKAVPIPPQPIYVHSSQSNVIRPPKQSGLPLNCQLPYKLRKDNVPFDGVGVPSLRSSKITCLFFILFSFILLFESFFPILY